MSRLHLWRSGRGLPGVGHIIDDLLAGFDRTGVNVGPEDLAARAAYLLGVPVELVAGHRPPGAPCGLSLITKLAVVVIVDNAASELLQLTATAHELIHVLRHHEPIRLTKLPEPMSIAGLTAQQVTYIYARGVYDSVEEREAEGGARAVAAALRAPASRPGWTRPGEGEMLQRAAGVLGAKDVRR